MSPPPSGSAPPTAHYDPDRLLAGYRAAWAQEALFDLRGGRAGAVGYDEFVDAAGNIRPSWAQFAEVIGERGRAASEEARAELTELLAGVHKGLRDLSKIISATQLSVPGEMQPLWGPDRRRMMP